MTAWEALREAPRRFGHAAAHGRPKLRGVVSPPRRIASVPFAVLMVALLVGGMVGLLALNTQLQNQAFEVRAAQRTANELGYRASDLESRVTRVNSPASLGRQASELGMAPNPHAVFIDLETGRVVGEPTKVTGHEIPSLVVLPEPEVPLEGEAPAVDPNSPDAGPAAAPPDPAAGRPLTPGSAATATDAAAPPTTEPGAGPTTEPGAGPTAGPSAEAGIPSSEPTPGGNA